MVVVQLYDGDTETELCESWKFDTQETQNAHVILQLPICVLCMCIFTKFQWRPPVQVS